MTEKTTQAPKATKRERLFALARDNYEPRKATRWPYLLRSGQQFKFEGPDRRNLRADLRALWRETHPAEAAPSDADMNAVVDDMRRLADKAAQDEPTADDQAADALAAHGIGEIPADRGLDLVTRLEDCPLPPGYVIPEPYIVSADGIHLIKGDGTGPARVAWAWLFPVRVYEDPDGDQLVELVWRDGYRWVSRLIRRAITKSGRKLVLEAGDAGLPVIEAEARQAERWLAAAEAANREAIVRHPVARQLGWQADGRTFVTEQDSPWRVEPKYQQQIPALRAHHSHGTLSGWQDAIKHAGPYPVVQMGIYEGLAAALLHVLGIDSFTVDHSGKSTRGKTITIMGGLSCWADPSEKGDGLFSWQTTLIEAERRFNLVNGLPVALDETRLVKDPAIVDTILYQVPKNHGKPRGGGWPSMIPWRTIVMSTGEQPATSFTSHQGASARVLSIQRPPFGTEGESSRAAADAMKRGIEANYGVSGPAFVKRLQEKLAERDGAADLRGRHAEMTEKLRGQTDMSGRRAPLVAGISLTAELARAWEITPFEVPGPADWLDMFNAADDPRDNRPEMALDLVREYLAAHADKMWGSGDNDHPPASGWIGHEAKEGPALLPAKLREELTRRGYDLDAALPGWLEMGVLLTLDSQRPSYLIPRHTAGHRTRHLIFKRDVLTPEDGET